MMGGSLEDRAADYYNFMVGNKPNVKYSSYISPAYRGVFAKEDLKALNEAMSPGSTASVHHGTASAEDVFTAVQDKFAITLIDPNKGRAFRNIEPTKWVKAGNRWYLYFGSDAEISRYGPFPQDLSPPAVGRLTPLKEEIDQIQMPGEE